MAAYIVLVLLCLTTSLHAQDKFTVSEMSIPKGNRESLVVGRGYVICIPNAYSPQIPAVMYWDSGKIDTLGSVEHVDAIESSPTSDIVATTYKEWLYKYHVDRTTEQITVLDSIALPLNHGKLSGIRGGGKYLFLDSLFEFEPTSRTWVFSIWDRCLDIQADPSGNEWALYAHNLFVRWNGQNSWDWHFSAMVYNKPWNLTHVMHADDKGRIWVLRDTLKYYDVNTKAWELGPSGLPDTTLPGMVSKFTSITQDDEGNLFLAGPSGVFKSAWSSMPFERLEDDLSDSLDGMNHYGLATNGFPYREFIHNPLGSTSTLYLATDVGIFTSKDRGMSWKHTPRTNAQEVSELIVDDIGVTIATSTGIYRKPVEGDWVKVFPTKGFMPIVMFAAPDHGFIYLLDRKNFATGSLRRNTMAWATQDTFKTFVLDTVGNWRRGFDEVLVDKDHVVHSIDSYLTPQLVTKRLLEDWSSDVEGLLKGGSHLHSATQMGSFALWWSSDEGRRASIFFREKAQTPWKVILERTGFPARICGVGHGNFKPAVIADGTSAFEFDGFNVRDLISPPEFQQLNSGMSSLAVSNTDDVWLLGYVPGNQVLLYSADRVKWHELRCDRGIPSRIIRAYGDSAFFVSNEGIFVVKLSESQSFVNESPQLQCHVSPNPAQNVITVSGLPRASARASFSIFERTGGVVQTGAVNVVEGALQVYIDDLPLGGYLISVESGEARYSSKFVIER